MEYYTALGAWDSQTGPGTARVFYTLFYFVLFYYPSIW